MTAKIRKLWTVLLCITLIAAQLPTMVSAADPNSTEKLEQTVTFTDHSEEIPGSTKKYVMHYGGEPHNAAAASTGDGTITYASSNEAIATVDDGGSVTAVSQGTVTITATAAETDTYKEGSASFSLSVSPKEVSITGITAIDRQYDPENISTIELDFTNASIDGMIPDDDLTIDSTNAIGWIKPGDTTAKSRQEQPPSPVPRQTAEVQKPPVKLPSRTLPPR